MKKPSNIVLAIISILIGIAGILFLTNLVNRDNSEDGRVNDGGNIKLDTSKEVPSDSRIDAHTILKERLNSERGYVQTLGAIIDIDRFTFYYGKHCEFEISSEPKIANHNDPVQVSGVRWTEPYDVDNWQDRAHDDFPTIDTTFDKVIKEFFESNYADFNLCI